MSSRILLVNPPFYRLLGSHYNANSLGIAYIASYLNEHGHDAWLYNADYLNEESYNKLSDLFDGFVDYAQYFKNNDHEIWEEVVKKIIDFEPEWVGYTSYTANLRTIDILSKKIKQRSPQIKQVIGGVHATLDNDVLKRLSAIDYSVKREGEMVMLDLVNGKNPEHIKGLGSRNINCGSDVGDSDVIKDIDLLPHPEREKFWGVTEEEIKKIDVSYICSIRGCPYRCNYCASPQHWKRDKTQYRSPESIMKEMHYIKEHHWDSQKEFDYSASANVGPKSELKIKDNTCVYFVDDVFTVKKKRVKTLLRMMIDQKINMPWKCEARTDHLDDEICELMAQAGCIRVKLGFESGSDRILKAIQKDETKEDMFQGTQMLKKAGVPFSAYFMTGFPDESDDDLRETIAFAKKIEADYYSLSILAPYYGTKMYYDLIEAGYELDKKPWEYFYHQTGSLMTNATITKPVLKEYLKLNELNTKGKGYV